jgi:hypothetical protein
MLQSSISIQMQEGKKKGFTLGKKKQTKDIRPNQWAKSNKEVHLDVTLTSIIDFNALE